VQFRKGYQQFWLQRDIPVTYPALWTIARKFLIAFPSSYLMDSGFSAVANLLTKKETDWKSLECFGMPWVKLYPRFHSVLEHSSINITLPDWFWNDP
jgi:hypothetical protein